MKEVIVVLTFFAIVALAMIAIVQGIFMDNWLQVINAIINVIFILLIINKKINGIRR